MSRILPRINSPKDLKELSLTELKKLASELREVIVETVARNGGHLAPNLGVVELTLALHYVFESPRDRIVWDVGHQCYAHKLITGRRDRFHTLRQYGGIAGYPRRSESPHDIVETGHSSTSISAGLGLATGIRLAGKEGRVLVVIGDGSMTAGLAFEGLNNAGHLREDLVVILNDNEMSISPNVGALSSYLSRKMTGRLARRIKKDIEGIMERLPGGEHFLHMLRKSEGLLKSALTPGMLFEALGFEYVGPVDGHDLAGLIKLFENIREMRGPLLVHVLTKKGKGYLPAETDPETFHGVGPFDPKTGRLRKSSGPPSYTEVFSRTMLRLGEAEPRLVAITAAMPTGTGLKAFGERFPERFFDVGICEQHAVTFAAGLALEGLIPVCAIYSTFLQRAFDQIIHDVALPNLHVIFAIDRGGIVGEDGPTHQGQFDLSYLRLIPNMTVMAPKDENELQHMLYTALSLPGPVAVRYPRGSGAGVPLDDEFREIPRGKAELLREGTDLLILAVGNMVHPALKAAEKLDREGISAAVVNARFVKPLDEELISDLAARIRRVVTVEENVLAGGFGSAVAECLADRGIKTNLKRIGLPDRFIEHGSPQILREKYGLTGEKIARQILGWLS
ncbi:1-deoxy-D-xylulose-5-phosphate synthase [Thermosulfurimonas sp. F29]|uniref:1-deoxy-D-xylulose-5-phosphate synthase n=1 Tax=Thermosulfurimonas sp. F29 TaxID=2867247 RepID=UPI001C829753|nr:1-deoxy-D-xylulose-5-phosphate synthase [Thermosulfurimonas sp. F29]MBX6423632.1 1-deoxy-D-xylulose-5-phosphate synthase [Thermosulfurimonas sp. F29]